MGQTVYVDLFFMINFSMDFLCFYLTFQLLSGKMSLLRTLIASAVGGVYANLALFISADGIWEIAIDIGICALMCLIAFGKCRSLILHTCIYLAVSMTLGGFMTALFSILNKADLPLSEIEGDGISAYLLALLAIISAVLTLVGGKFFRKKSARKYTEVHIDLEGKSRSIPAMCDSGNLLREPISGKPCIVTDIEALNTLLSREVLNMARVGGIPKKTPNSDASKRIRLVPTHSATGDSVLLAIKPDRVSIGMGKDTKEVDALIALCPLGKTADGAQALVPTELL